jgi:hypothetical protein
MLLRPFLWSNALIGTWVELVLDGFIRPPSRTKSTILFTSDSSHYPSVGLCQGDGQRRVALVGLIAAIRNGDTGRTRQDTHCPDDPESLRRGVETLDQLVFLKANGCSEAQGYDFSRPLKAPDFALGVIQRR